MKANYELNMVFDKSNIDGLFQLVLFWISRLVSLPSFVSKFGLNLRPNCCWISILFNSLCCFMSLRESRTSCMWLVLMTLFFLNSWFRNSKHYQNHHQMKEGNRKQPHLLMKEENQRHHHVQKIRENLFHDGKVWEVCPKLCIVLNFFVAQILGIITLSTHICNFLSFRCGYYMGRW